MSPTFGKSAAFAVARDYSSVWFEITVCSDTQTLGFNSCAVTSPAICILVGIIIGEARLGQSCREKAVGCFWFVYPLPSSLYR